MLDGAHSDARGHSAPARRRLGPRQVDFGNGPREGARQLTYQAVAKGKIDVAAALCTARGLRLTQQRKAVLLHLLAAGRPLSAYDILAAVRPREPSLTPASTYRCLDFLVEHGLAHRLETLRAFVACDHPEHPHAGQFLICRQCGTVVETDDTRVADAADRLCRSQGFEIEAKTIELTGLCGPCIAPPR